MVEVKTEKSKEILPILITENKHTQPLLGLDWLDKLEIGLQCSKKTNVIRHVEKDERRERIIHEYEDLFKNNHTIEDLTIDIQLKKDVKPIQQQGRPVPFHFQKIVREELEKLKEKGHLEKGDKTTENCFISTAVNIIKRQIGQNSAGFEKTKRGMCKKKSSKAEHVEELISKISAEITKNDVDIWMSKIDLVYAYGQAKSSEEAAKHCAFSIIGDFTGHYSFKKGFYGLSDNPTVFQEHINTVLEFKTPVWLDDIICVSNGSIEDHDREVREVLTKLQNAEYRASERKTGLVKKELTWLGYYINQKGVKTRERKRI